MPRAAVACLPLCFDNQETEVATVSFALRQSSDEALLCLCFESNRVGSRGIYGGDRDELEVCFFFVSTGIPGRAR